MTKQVNERELILAVLLEVTENGQFSHIVLRDVLAKYQYLEKRERAFITRVVDGTLEHLIEIDYILDCFSKVKVKKMKPVIRGILRSAVYQMKYMDSVPDRAVCSEAVRLAGRKGFSGLKGYVNGVLRSIARGLDHIPYPEEEKKALSIRYSCPEWMLDLWGGTYDRETVETMLRDFQTEKPLSIRCCLDRTEPEQLRRELEEDGVSVEAHPYLPYAFCISGYDHLEEISAFREGRFAVQDVSSMLVGEIAAPKAGDRVLDVCAAPGGKALHAAEKLCVAERRYVAEKGCPGEQPGAEEKGCGYVEARDLTEAKVELIRDNIRRSGLANIRAVCQDAMVYDDRWKASADIVIADLPCSGLGVIGKKPDLKYRISPQGIESLTALQRQILSCAQAYVKPGGTLIYSTCTVSPEENQGNVRWFLKEYPEFAPGDLTGSLCGELRESVTEKCCLQLLPGIHKCDGFFIAKLIRKEEHTV